MRIWAHPSRIEGVVALAEYLRLLGVPISDATVRGLLARDPSLSEKEGTRHVFGPAQIDRIIQARTGLEADLWYEQRRRNALRARNAAKAEAQAAPPRPKPAGTVPAPYECERRAWSNRAVHDDAPFVPGERLGAYVMRRGEWIPVGEGMRPSPGSAPFGAVFGEECDTAGLLGLFERVERAVADVVWWRASPTAPEDVPARAP